MGLRPYQKQAAKQVLLHLPLKQGLKLSQIQSGSMGVNCSFTSSIKTRIETAGKFIALEVKAGVLLHLPLKQGLKLIIIA